MGQLQTAIQVLVGEQYGRGMDGAKIAKRLIEAGLEMMAEEGDLSPESRIVPTFDKYDDFDTFHIAKRVELTAPFATSEMAEVLEVAGQQFFFYAEQHFRKGTPESLDKCNVNLGMANVCFHAIGAELARRPVQLSAGHPILWHYPHIAALAQPYTFDFGDESPQEAAREPQESVSKARSSDGTPALSVSPSRSEIVAWVMAKADKAKKDGDEHVFFVLQAIAGELEQHLEERQVNVAYALREFYADCHARNVKAGWWTDLATGITKKRSVGELFMLMVTELWEAYEAYITREPDDKLPQFPGLGVELGDLQIRLADFCGALAAGSVVEDTSTRNPGNIMFLEVGEIAQRYESIRKTDEAKGDQEMGEYLPSADVGEMVVAKLAFNAIRPDHKIENRLKEDGKRT